MAGAARTGKRPGARSQRQSRRMRGRYGGPVKISEALVPPKPNEFDRTWRILRSLACFGTRSISQPGDGFSRLRVGGAMPSRIARIEKIASTLPAAPSKWPIADLVDDIDSLYA